MNRMIKRFLAAVLITSMLMGSNGVSYAAEIADGDSIVGTEEVTQEAVDEEQVESPGDAEASEPANEESAEEVQTQEEAGEGQEADAHTVEEADADASEEENENTAAEEEISEAASGEETEETVESEEGDSAVTEEAAAAEDAEAPENADADAAAAELTAEEAAAAAAQAQEEVFTAGELVYHGHDYDVTLAYDENAKIPATAELKVREIEKGTSEYESYLAGAEAAAGKGVAEARFFDITIVAPGTDGQQQEIQPQSQVRVNITYHKALEVAAEGEVQAMHFEDGTADAEVVNTDTNGGSEVSEIAFDAESFSVYGIVYTVDFTYDGFTYSMPGEGSIYLSELAEILGLYETDLDKAFSVGNVSNVSFTDYDLVKIEKQADGDWLLTSLAPFTSEETLTIEMNDGVKFIVDVTDAAIPSSSDLRDFITAVTIDAPVNEDGEYMVTPGTGYKISFSLAEGAGLQFDNTALTYSIPSGLNADGQEGTFSVTIEKDGQSYVIAGNTYKIENDTLTVTWNKNSGNYDKLTASGNVKFWLNFEGEFDETASEIVFSDGITKKIEIDNSSSVTASKSAAVDLANKKVNYTVAVTSTGNSTNVRIEDTITADTEGVLTLDPTSITAESSKTGEVGFVKNVEGNSFSCVIDSMQDGEVVTLTYSADIDTSKIPVDVNNNPTVVIGNNRVKVSNEYDPTPVEREVNTRIDYTPKIQKDGMVLNEDGKTFDCKFTFNTDGAYSGANHTITDTLGEYLTLEGTTGAKITIIDSEGNRTQQFLNWGETNPNFGTLNKAGENDSFVYITPNIPGEYKYIVEYQVKVTGTEGLVEQITVSNTVQTDGDKSSTGTGTYTPATGELKLYKAADKIDYENKEVTWTVSIDVPETGLTEAYAALVDKLPQSGWIDEIGGSAWDTFVQRSETVTGLIGTESYTLSNDPANHKFTVEFKNSNGEPGLDAGQKRVVRVTFKTAIDPNWLDAAKTRSWLANHVNNVELGTKTGSASVVIAGAGVTKTGELCGYRTVNGTRLPIYRFRLLLKNVTKDDNTIKDTFDRELLEPLYVDQLESTEGLTSDDKWYGWHTTNENMSGVRSSSAVSYVDTPYGMDIITSADSMVHNSLTTTGFYEVTRIDYFLTVKDAAALKKIQDLAYADENNEYTFNNSAEWENTTGDVDVTYEYKGLKKELLTSDDDLTKTDENVTAQFRITLNPGGQTLNGGEPMTMTDTVTNLSVDVSTIQASPSAGVSWDMTGNTVTYVIPDSTQVIITYTATVIFDKIGDKGDTINSTFSNVAEMKGYNDKIEKTAHRKNNGGGSGAVYNIHLLKYKKGDMTKRLQGAEFALLDADKNPIQDKDGNNVTFETDENGLITVEGDAEAFGWTLFADTDYYLKEIKAPEGFVLKNTYYKFIISENGLPDYDKNIYYSGDTMTCKNEKPGATLEVEKALGEDSIWPEGEIVVFTLQSVTEGAPMPESGGETVILSEPGKGTFGEIEYPVSDKEQTYEYKITESEGFGEGWTNSGDITATVVISPDDGSGNVTTTVTYSPENKTITNTKDEGGLVVSKKVVSAVTADKSKDFSFKVELKDKSINGTYGTMTFTDGVAEFTLKDGERKSATGLAKGIEYTVTETAYDDFNTTSTGETGEIVEKETKTAEFTNTRKTGELEISKTVVSPVPAEKDANYTFTVTLTNGGQKISGTYSGYSFDENGQATVTVKGGKSVTIEGLPVGTDYTVEEAEYANFNTEATGDTGKISETKATAAFKNTRKTGKVTISKTVVSPVPAEATKEFTFTIELSDNTVNGTFSEVQFKNGVATVTVAGDSSKTIEGLPEGVIYTVTEAADNDFENTKKEGETGSITAAGATAAFTNTRKTGELEVTKTVVSNTASDKTKDFSFTVTLTPALSGEFGGTTFNESGVATFKLKDGEKKKITGLPVGYSYKVEEEAAAGFVTTKTGDTGDISATAATAAFTNTKDEGGLVVSKSVESDIANDKTKEFEITVTLDDKSVNGTYGGMTFENGVATFTLKDGDTKNATGLAKGIRYTVKEKDYGDFITTYEGQAGEIADETAVAAVKNSRKKGSLEISKTVVSPVPAEETADYTFTVTLTNGGQKISGTYSDISFDENGQATVTVKGGKSVTIEGLPVGTDYTVKEAEYANFDTEATGAAGTISETKATAAFTNTRKTGKVTISKTVVSPVPAEETKEFTFTIELSDTTVNGTFSDVKFTNGVAEVTVAGGSPKTIEGLPEGVNYTVTEAADNDFENTKKEGETGSITAAGATAAFENTRKTGELEVTKKVVSSTASDKQKDFSFRVTLTPALSGTFGGMTFDENGVAKFTLKGGETKSATGLPVGCEYKVEEDTAAGFVTTKTGVTGKISAIKATAAFTNTKAEGGLIVSKSVVSAVTADKQKKDFGFEVVLTDKSINGTYGEMTFENGVAKFTLKDGETKFATGLPDAIGYVVSESSEPASDFIIISDGATGNIVHNETNTAEFTNTRKTGNLEISKTVVSPVPAEKDANYTFTVTLTNGEQKISGEYSGYYFDENGQATVTVKGNASVTIEGLPVGTTYSVVESKYDNFDTESTGEAGDINDTKTSVAAFTNTRKTGSLEVTKTVANKNSTNTTSKFSFTVTLGDKTINGSFGDMTFNEGVAKFTLKDGEKAAAEGLPAGVSYVVEEANAEGFKTTKEEEAGEIKETIITASFTNTYLATGDVDLEVRKALEGRPLTDGQFGFELIGADGKVKQTKYCDSTGRVYFDRITYSQDDLQKNKEGFLEDTRIEYTVKEVIPADAADKGYTYDAEPKTITVTLHDNEDGTIKAEASPKPENVTFHNKYEAKGSIELNAGKILLGERTLEKDKFEFELKDDKGKVLQRKKNDADGKVAFDAIEYTQDDIYEYDAATGQYKIKDKTSYEYKIQEVIPDDAVNADGTTYKEASEAEKKAGGFKKDGYTYDGTVHTITVELTDKGDGTIDAKVAGSETEPGATGVVITNAYDSDGTLKLNAEKIFKNGTLKGGEFTFELMDAAGKVLQSKKNDAAGNVSFDMITYKLADVAKAPFTYTVREVPGSRTDVKYDATVYTVTVELKDKGDGTLEVTKKIDNGGALKFENEQLNVETSVTIGGVKQLKGQTLKKDQFKFVLADENGKWLDTATNDAEGNFTFKPITYKFSDLNGEKTKVYSYSVWEVKGSESGITYDKTVYTVKVTVTDNGDGTMTAKADKAKSDIKFVNTTTERKSKKTSSSKGSKTGDEAPLGVLFGGLGIGAIGLAVLLWNRKRRNRNKK